MFELLGWCFTFIKCISGFGFFSVSNTAKEFYWEIRFVIIQKVKIFSKKFVEKSHRCTYILMAWKSSSGTFSGIGHDRQIFVNLMMKYSVWSLIRVKGKNWVKVSQFLQYEIFTEWVSLFSREVYCELLELMQFIMEERYCKWLEGHPVRTPPYQKASNYPRIV